MKVSDLVRNIKTGSMLSFLEKQRTATTFGITSLRIVILVLETGNQRVGDAMNVGDLVGENRTVRQTTCNPFGTFGLDL